MRLRRPTLAALFVLVLAAAFGVTAIVRADQDRGAPLTPQETVRAFLTASVVDQDGFAACRYLAEPAIVEARTAGGGCETALDGARLRLGRTDIERQAQVDQLTYRVEQHGREHAAVTVSGFGGARTFGLAYGDFAEQTEFMNPPTPWRITSGVTGVLR